MSLKGDKNLARGWVVVASKLSDLDFDDPPHHKQS